MISLKRRTSRSQQVIKTKPRENFWQVEAPKPEYKIARDEKPKPRVDINIEYEEPEENSTAKSKDAPKEQDIEKVVITDEKDNENFIPNFKLIGEAFKTYLIVEIENELYFIDKHRSRKNEF